MALKKSNVKNDPTSTIIGIAGSVLTILVVLGFVTHEQTEQILSNLNVAIPAVISLVSSVILIFSKIFHKE